MTTILSVPYIVINYRRCVAQQVSRTFSSCITERVACQWSVEGGPEGGAGVVVRACCRGT